MTDFETKHEELYIEELKILLPKYSAIKIQKDDKKIYSIFKEIDFRKKNNIIAVLKILNGLNSEERTGWLNYFDAESYNRTSLKDRIFEIFEKEIIELILIQEEQNNE